MENEHMEPTMNEQQDNQPHLSSPKKEGGLGAVIGIIIIIILLALGAIYYFTAGIDKIQNGQPSGNDAAMTPDEEAAALKDQGASTDLSSIEADVNATDLSGLDNASADFTSELQAQ